MNIQSCSVTNNTPYSLAIAFEGHPNKNYSLNPGETTPKDKQIDSKCFGMVTYNDIVYHPSFDKIGRDQYFIGKTNEKRFYEALWSGLSAKMYGKTKVLLSDGTVSHLNVTAILSNNNTRADYFITDPDESSPVPSGGNIDPPKPPSSNDDKKKGLSNTSIIIIVVGIVVLVLILAIGLGVGLKK